MFKKSILFLLFACAGGGSVIAMENGGKGNGNGGGDNPENGQNKPAQNAKDIEIANLKNLVNRLQNGRAGSDPYRDPYRRVSYGAFGDRMDDRVLTGKDHVKKICTKSVHEALCGGERKGKDAVGNEITVFDPNFKLEQAFNGVRDASGKVIEGREGSIPGGLGMALMTSGLVAATGGFIDAVDETAKKASRKVFDAAGSKLSDLWQSFNRAFFHRGANPVSGYDISRWTGAVTNMIDGLIETANDAKSGANIEGNFADLLGLGSDEQGGLNTPVGGTMPTRGPGEDGDDALKKAIDKNWLENRRLYLVRISQVVAEISFRQKYYGDVEPITQTFRGGDSEIFFCLERLKEALQGETARMVLDEHDVRVPTGGIYARIYEAKSLSELASTQTVTTLKLFKRHIRGLLKELTIWVKVKAGEENGKHKGGHNTTGLGGYSSYGYDD